MEQADGHLLRLSDYVRLLRRHARIFGTMTLLGAVLAGGVSSVLPKMYRARADVAIQPSATDVERQLFGANDVESQKQLLTSTRVVHDTLQRAGLASGEEAVRQFRESRLHVDAIGEATLRVAVTAERPDRCKRLADDLLAVYSSTVAQDTQERLRILLRTGAKDNAVAEARLLSLQTQLATTSPVLRGSLETERDQTFAALRSLAARQVELQQAAESARLFTILEAATTPQSPSSPKILLNTLLGLLAGACAGGLAAVARESQVATRRKPVEAAALYGPVLATVGVDVQAGATGDAYEILALRAAVLARATQDGKVRVALVPMTAEVEEPSQNLARALALVIMRSGRKVIAFEASMTASTPVAANIRASDWLADDTARRGSTPGPGLTAVIADDSSLDLLTTPALHARLQHDDTRPQDFVAVVPALERASTALDVAGALSNVVLVVARGESQPADLQAVVARLEVVSAQIIGVVVVT